jgi:RNA polymerase sigma-70 factor (ECF subfamily)
MNSVSDKQFIEVSGPFEARYRAFLETIAQLRPSLHRYCARMTGSVMDGEDVVQEALFEAYRKLDQFDETRPLKPWLFRIAHNRCVDFLRKREVRTEAEQAAITPEVSEPDEPVALDLGDALEHLVINLPPKERASVLLKDVFEYSLEEVAELTGSTVGGVKAALHRGRTKLAETSPPATANRVDPEMTQIIRLYVDRFNRHDWDGVRELIRADAHVNVADRFAGKLADAPYFSTYENVLPPWKLAAGEVDGEPVVVVLKATADTWSPHSIVRLSVRGQRINQIADYWHCPWMLSSVTSLEVFG